MFYHYQHNMKDLTFFKKVKIWGGGTEEVCQLIRHCGKTLPCFAGSYSMKQIEPQLAQKVLNSQLNKKG